jgi:signal transduction histidine kinase
MDGFDLTEKATILVVDDTADNLVLLSGLLKDNYKVKIASGGEKALNIAASDSPPDLILLDIMMPGMDGYEVCRRLKRDPRTMNIPVIFLTAKTGAEDEKKGLELGAIDYITKPISPPIVMARVKNHLALQEKIIELESAKSVAEKANLAKSYFLSTVSHELRTPLTSIRGALALIAGGVVGELPAAFKSLVDIAHKNSERLILLINDILDMEKIEAGKIEFNASSVKLMPLLKQALDGNRAYAEQYQVSYELESELPEAMISVDSNRMMQVFANLLSNAAKYSPSGGKVLVAVERIDQRIRVAVKDNGPGIPDEFKGRIFQKFAQADSSDTRKKGGTGLGLSISKAIIEQMGGCIWFNSQPDVQTAFYVELPEWVENKSP